MEREIVLHCHNSGTIFITVSAPLSTLDGDKIGSVLPVIGRYRITKNVTPAQLQRNA